MKKFISKLVAALAVLALAQGAALAGSIPIYTGPAGTNPLPTYPQNAGDFNSLINQINADVAPGGTGAVSSALTIPTVASAVNGFKLTPSITGSPIIFGVGGVNPDTNVDLVIAPKGTGLVEFGATSTVPNGSGATTLGSLGPALAATTVQEWFTFKNSAGTIRYIPAF